MNNLAFQDFLKNRRVRVKRLMNKYLLAVAQNSPLQLKKALKYVTGGGKRIRPLVVYLIGESYGAGSKILDAPACALEMIHIFSLVHDDLPAMDNDMLRRGKPTCHLAFDEATAILVGDALVACAFQILNGSKFISNEQKVLMGKILAETTGPQGMIGGQYLDLYMPRDKVSTDYLEKMYSLKTGALISAAVKLGAIAAGVDNKKELNLLERLAQKIGLAFQITDDILNIKGSVKKLGKNVGTDKARGKITYPSLVGLAKAQERVRLLWREISSILGRLKIQKKFLPEFIDYLMQREF